MTEMHPQRGFSLIELMISITLGLIILTAIALVFFNASQSRTELERVSRQIENGRYAIDLLSSDLRLAGFYGELDVSSVAGTALTNPCSVNPADWKTAMAVHVQGYDNPASAPGTCTLTNLKPNTDVIVVRRVRTCVVGAAGCEPTAVSGGGYLQVSLCATDTGIGPFGTDKYLLDVSSGAFNFKKRNCTTPADLRRYYVHIYYISTDNGAGQSIPTLTRLELDVSGGSPSFPAEPVPLVEGIEELNLEYGIDQDGDGAPDVYTADPNDYPVGACTGGCPLNNWMNVVTVKMHILARNLEESSDYTGGKTYTLGVDKNGAAVTVTPTDKYRRHVYAGLVRIANISNRRDRP